MKCIFFDDDEIQIEEVSSEFQERKKKKDFYEFDMDDEALTNNPDAEAIEAWMLKKVCNCTEKFS